MESHFEIICEGNEVALSPTENRVYIGKGYDGGYISDFPEINLQQVHKKGYRAQWSPNGDELAISCNIAGTPYGVFLVSSDGSHQRQILDLEIENAHVKWSPDGKMLLISDDNLGIHIVNSDGSNLKRITANTTFSGASWSPNGNKIVYCDCEDSPNLMLYELRTRCSKLLMKQIFTSPLWIPFSNKILVEHYDERVRKRGVGFVDANTGKLEKIMFDDWGLSGGSWCCSPNGRYIVSWYRRKIKRLFSSSVEEGIALLSLHNRKMKRVVNAEDIESGYHGSGFSWFADSAGFLFGSGNIYKVTINS